MGAVQGIQPCLSNDIPRRYEDLLRRTETWLQQDRSAVPNRWYELVDRTYEEITGTALDSEERCDASEPREFVKLVQNNPFPPRRPSSQAVEARCKTFLEATGLTTAEVGEEETTKPPFWEDVRTVVDWMEWLWAPRCVDGGVGRNLWVPAASLATASAFRKTWELETEPLLLEQMSRCHSPHRSVHVWFLHWTSPVATERRCTLLYVDVHRRLKGLYDPFEDEVVVVGTTTRLRRTDALRHVMRDFYWDDGRGVEVVGPATATPPQAELSAALCLVAFAFVHLSGYLDVRDAGHTAQRMLLTAAGGPDGTLAAVRWWMREMVGGDDPAHRLARTGWGGTCGVLRSNGTFCSDAAAALLCPLHRGRIHPRWWARSNSFESILHAYLSSVSSSSDSKGVDHLSDTLERVVARVVLWMVPPCDTFHSDAVVWNVGMGEDRTTKAFIEQHWTDIALVTDMQCGNAGRYLRIMCWDGAEAPPRFTLFHREVHRQRVAFFDPLPHEVVVADADSDDGNPVTRAGLLRRVLGLGIENDVDEQVPEGHAALSPDWTGWVCLATYVVVHRFGYSDLVRAGRLVRHWVVQNGLEALAGWLQRLGAAISFSDFARALRIDHGPCLAALSDHEFCQQPPATDQPPLCYCPTHTDILVPGRRS